MVFSLGPTVNNLKEEILYNWPSSDNTLVRRHIIQNEYYEVDSKVKFKFTNDQRSARTQGSEDEQSSKPIPGAICAGEFELKKTQQ